MEEKQRKQWDCGSTLYDSYELNSFKRQIDSAIANSPRTHSMPHLPQPTKLQLQIQESPPSSQIINNNKSSSFKISRTFQKLLRFVFKSGSNKSNSRIRSSSFRSYPKDQEQLVYDKLYESEPVLLSTIPELPDFETAGLSPDISNFVRKSASERFTATATVGVSCSA
ncbi:uncharacterized protein LOC127108239 [Lathyrus oleraceus]|uniref:Uncharacterized protein n=1 Tax=Pisum sativum TaxID=3888 RepID=A0A9D4VIV1_PEA|nr:uncharacterized protein LOC127108239 [Pisum sativum]KAI5383485.1 hypothetical protein KIW84_070749 [Pisum sativum]